MSPYRFLVVTIAVAASVLVVPSPAQDRVEINGVTVLLADVPAREKIAIAMLLPTGLIDDVPGRSQWSHLIEHVLVSPDGPVDLRRMNAETMIDATRYEWHGDPGEWEAGVARCATWLDRSEFTARSLEREIPRVVAELENLQQRGTTGKFAMNAWALWERGAEGPIGMLADVRRADAKAVSSHHGAVRGHGAPIVAVVGRLPERTALLKALEARWRAPELTRRPAAPAPRAAKGRTTWDLTTTHAVFSWPWPATDAEEIRWGHVVVGALVRSFSARPPKVVRGAATGTFVPARAAIVVDVPLREASEEALAAVRARLDTASGRIAGGASSLRMARFDAVSSISQVSDPARAMAGMDRMARGAGTAELAVGVALVQREARWGPQADAAARALVRPAGEPRRAGFAARLSSAHRHELLVVPR